MSSPENLDLALKEFTFEENKGTLHSLTVFIPEVFIFLNFINRYVLISDRCLCT